ncbi:butyrophilin-like protein 3 [Danio aesculapii]|uniref:butyrophilin-like protein 3 n=1 Tax=Danio aesculapii TaxID=1142201 RepID=UPI0024BF6881|nr:butyrophilin-like protein 3 [Danio aesculapii]
MKYACFTLMLIGGITDSRSDQFAVVGSADPVFAFAGEDVILPCSVKPNISVVDMRVEWFRLDQKYSVVHLYEDHVDRNTEQIQSYKGRTELNHQLLQTGNASLRLSAVTVSDEGRYKCFIQSSSSSDDPMSDFKVEAVGSPPVITVDGFDRSGGLHLQCDAEGWYPEPDLEWLDSEGVRLSPETTEIHRNTDRFSVKHTVTVHQRDGKIHCRVRVRHHMLETLISSTSNMYIYWRTSVTVISVSVVVTVIAGILIAVAVYKYREHKQLQRENSSMKSAINHLRKLMVKVTLDAESAHPNLIVSEDGKQVKCGNTQTVNEENNRFTEYLGVVGKEGFSSGCFYFEVQVKDQTVWYLGVTRESADRKDWIRPSPGNGYWTLSQIYKEYNASSVSLSLSVIPRRIGVFVYYEKGLVSFYDVDSMSHIYSYTGQAFNEKLCPFVCLGYYRNKNSTPLIICDVTNEESE